MSQAVLMREFQALAKEKWVVVDLQDENVYRWNIALIVLNPDSLYYGGYFKALMSFPKDYPYKPPDFRFTTSLWHPNIYPDGRLCISILHAPGDDAMSGETAGERWSPAQRVESVLISILSLLDDAEVSSPANVDASVQWRNDKDGFKERVKQDVERSKSHIPEGFVMPTHESTKPQVEEKLDDNFWVDSDAEDLDLDDDFDFDDDAANGSESDQDLNNDSEDDEEFDDDTQKIEKLEQVATPKAKVTTESKVTTEPKEKDDAEMTDVED